MKELSLHILDIAQNSVRAKASNVIISVEELKECNLFRFTIDDDGVGISDDILKTIKNPFTTTRTTRKVGLGIPLLNSTCELCNGKLDIRRKEDKGTILVTEMEYNNIDRPPMGDIASTVVGLICSNPLIHFVYSHSYNKNTFVLDTDEINEILDGTPITDTKIYTWLKEYVKENIDSLKV